MALRGNLPGASQFTVLPVRLYYGFGITPLAFKKKDYCRTTI